MNGPYAEHLLDARDVCSNCFRVVRIERVDPVMSTSDFRHDLDSHYSRRKRTTTREYHDSDPRPTQCKTTFCACGVEGTSERLWDPTALSRARFKTLLTSGLKTLESKGIVFDRPRKRETIAYALQSFDDSGDADRAFSEAIEMGLVAQASADASDSRA